MNNTLSTQKPPMYADIDLGLNFHPGLKDIRPIYDLAAVKASVKNLVLTGGGDKVFHPEIGSNIFAYLFEPADKFIAAGMERAIESVLDRYEPRVDQVEVNVIDKSDVYTYNINIIFRVIAPDISTEVNFYLERIR